jgi:dsDNA-binding SOS-regulon protein
MTTLEVIQLVRTGQEMVLQLSTLLNTLSATLTDADVERLRVEAAETKENLERALREAKEREGNKS